MRWQHHYNTIAMRHTFITLLLALVATALHAQRLPEGARQLYYGERSYERYGMQRHTFTIYQHQGKTWLQRTQGFSGAAEFVADADAIARNARLVTMPLTDKQLKSIARQLANARFLTLYEAYQAEQTAYEAAQQEAVEQYQARNIKKIVNAKGDTLLVRRMQPLQQRMSYYPPARWQQDISWDGVAPALHGNGTYSNLDKDSANWTIGHPARYAYMRAIDNFHALLNDMVYRYKLKHPYEDEFYTYRYYTSGGMMLRRTVDGRTVRTGSGIELNEKNGQWYVCSYVGELEDTARVDDNVARRVLNKVLKLNTQAIKPELKTGEKMVKSMVSDGGFWSMTARFHTRENIVAEDGIHESIIEPKWAAKDYQKLMKDIESINDYLWGFVKLKNNKQP